MYRSNYHHTSGKPKYRTPETIESTINKHFNEQELLFTTLLVPYSVRNRHVYVVGKTQHGKSTLLHSMISQDIENGAGVCVIDPKPSGEKLNLVESVLHHIPARREKDVIYFDAAKPIPIDVMSWKTEEERQTLAADLMLTFMQFVSQKDGDRWPGILRYTIHTILEARECTFLNIYDFLADEDYRLTVLERVKTEHLKKYWKGPYKLFPKDSAVPILNRMATFQLVPPLNTMLGNAPDKLKIEDVIRERKILLINLTGAGKESGNFIGTLIVSRIQQAIFRRLRVPFHLYADEFQNFQTSSFDTILSEAGGLGLRLTLSNQYVGQLEERIRKSVFGNVSTFFVFAIDDADSHFFKSRMPMGADGKLMPTDLLADQSPYRALYKIAGQEPIFKLTPKPPPEPTQEEVDRAHLITKRTLEEYACTPNETQHTLMDEHSSPTKEQPHSQAAEAKADPSNDAGRASPAGTVFRPQKQGRSAPPTKARADQERHTDDKPEPEALG